MMPIVFFRTLSYYFEGTQNNFQTYINYIYNFAKINYNNLKDNFEYIIRDGKKFYFINDDYNNNNSKIPLLDYIENIKNTYQYAGDLEISLASVIYNKIIVILIYEYNNELNLNGYKVYNKFCPNNIKINENNLDNYIFIEYEQNNHYNLLIYNDNNNFNDKKNTVCYGIKPPS